MNRRVFFARGVAGVLGLVGLGKGAVALASPSGLAPQAAAETASASLHRLRRLTSFQQDLVSSPLAPGELREAFEGDANAQWLLGEYLAALPHTEADWTRALSRLRVAARDGDTWAAEFLGNDPQEWADDAGWSPRGLMESQSVVLRPFYWLYDAAGQGCCYAMHGLARIYAAPDGAQHNAVEALLWTILSVTYQGGASWGYPPSRYALALWKELARRVSPDEYEIVKVRASLWRHRSERNA